MSLSFCLSFNLQLASVPSRAEILLELTEKEIGTSGHKGCAAWLSSGLKIQEMQYGFGSFSVEF